MVSLALQEDDMDSYIRRRSATLAEVEAALHHTTAPNLKALENQWELKETLQEATAGASPRRTNARPIRDAHSRRPCARSLQPSRPAPAPPGSAAGSSSRSSPSVCSCSPAAWNTCPPSSTWSTRGSAGTTALRWHWLSLVFWRFASYALLHRCDIDLQVSDLITQIWLNHFILLQHFSSLPTGDCSLHYNPTGGDNTNADYHSVDQKSLSAAFQTLSLLSCLSDWCRCQLMFKAELSVWYWLLGQSNHWFNDWFTW